MHLTPSHWDTCTSISCLNHLMRFVFLVLSITEVTPTSFWISSFSILSLLICPQIYLNFTFIILSITEVTLTSFWIYSFSILSLLICLHIHRSQDRLPHFVHHGGHSHLVLNIFVFSLSLIIYPHIQFNFMIFLILSITKVTPALFWISSSLTYLW